MGGSSSRLVVALLVCTAASPGGAGAGAADGPPSGRAVLGTVVEAGVLEIADGHGGWVRIASGAPVFEDTELRSNGAARSLIALGRHGVIALRERSGVHIGGWNAEGIRITVEPDAEVTFRLPDGSGLAFLTDTAIVRTGARTGDPASDAIQGILQRRAGETTLSVVRGMLLVRSHQGRDYFAVHGGEEATVADATVRPRLAYMGAAAAPAAAVAPPAASAEASRDRGARSRSGHVRPRRGSRR
jgi:hypothetical protein